jgi:HEAT repeat protein
MRFTTNIALLAFALGFGSIANVAWTDEAETLAKLDEQLAELVSYDYQRDGGRLREMETTIFQLPTNSPLRAVIEQKLIQALKDANSVGRGVICRQLRVIGTDKCVSAVAVMLTDPELSHLARYTLQGIGSDAALQAMHQAVSKTSGTLQVGLLNSLSDCDYLPLRSTCVPLLDSDDPQVVAAAVRALGRLGGPSAVDALSRARPAAANPLARDIDLALLNCAERSLKDGDAQAAVKIYMNLITQPGAVRLAALRGLVITQPQTAADRLVQAMKGDDSGLTRWAIHLTTRVSGEEATRKFVGLLDQFPVTEKVLMLRALGARGEKSAVPKVVDAAGSDETAIRLAALESLGDFSAPEALDSLLGAAARGDDSSQRIARASLARMEGAESRLADIAQSAQAALDVQVEAIRALAARDARDTTPLMLRLAKDDRAPKRAAAIDALGQLTPADRIDLLVQLTLDAKSVEDLPGIEAALARVLLRIDDPADRATPLLQTLPTAAPEVRPILIRQLSKSGTAEALATVRTALRHSNVAIADAAVAALAAWPNREAADDLIPLIESARIPELKTMALEGYLRIAAASDEPTKMFLDVLNRVESANDKKLVLNEIGLTCDSLEAMDMTRSLFDDPQLRANAAIATIRIAYKLRNRHRDTVRQVLEDVLAKVDHPDVQQRAQDVLNDIDKYRGYIMQWVAVGPFVDDGITSGEECFRTAFEPEQDVASKLDWKPLTLGINDWDINLEATYGSLDHCAAYVRTMIWSPVDQNVQIEAGSDDALRVWVNGKIVYDEYTVRGAAPRQTLVPAQLKKGWNELMLKVVDHEGGWVFGCRVRQPDGKEIEGLKYEAR